MPKRPSYEIKREILLTLRERPASYAELERKVNTGFQTVKANCEELEQFGNVIIKKVKSHPANGKPAHSVVLTKQGLSVVKKMT